MVKVEDGELPRVHPYLFLDNAGVYLGRSTLRAMGEEAKEEFWVTLDIALDGTLTLRPVEFSPNAFCVKRGRIYRSWLTKYLGGMGFRRYKVYQLEQTAKGWESRPD